MSTFHRSISNPSATLDIEFAVKASNNGVWINLRSAKRDFRLGFDQYEYNGRAAANGGHTMTCAIRPHIIYIKRNEYTSITRLMKTWKSIHENTKKPARCWCLWLLTVQIKWSHMETHCYRRCSLHKSSWLRRPVG